VLLKIVFTALIYYASLKYCVNLHIFLVFHVSSKFLTLRRKEGKIQWKFSHDVHD
jgi:hypothetical protein